MGLLVGEGQLAIGLRIGQTQGDGSAQMFAGVGVIATPHVYEAQQLMDAGEVRHGLQSGQESRFGIVEFFQ